MNFLQQIISRCKPIQYYLWTELIMILVIYFIIKDRTILSPLGITGQIIWTTVICSVFYLLCHKSYCKVTYILLSILMILYGFIGVTTIVFKYGFGINIYSSEKELEAQIIQRLSA